MAPGARAGYRCAYENRPSPSDRNHAAEMQGSPMTRLTAPDGDPCRCEFRRMMWGLAAGLLSLIGVSLIRHEWVSEHLYLTLAVVAVGCIITTGSGFGVGFYYQCLTSQNKR